MNDGVGSGYAHNKLRDLVFQSNEDHNNQFDYDEFERILKAEYHSGIKWNPNGVPLLHSTKNERMLMLLKKYGANLDEKNFNKTVLHVAVEYQDEYWVEILVRLGANPIN